MADGPIEYGGPIGAQDEAERESVRAVRVGAVGKYAQRKRKFVLATIVKSNEREHATLRHISKAKWGGRKDSDQRQCSIAIDSEGL